MTRGFEFRMSQFILALILLGAGAACLVIIASNGLKIGERNLTSIGLLLAGLVCYAGVLAIVAMSKTALMRASLKLKNTR